MHMNPNALKALRVAALTLLLFFAACASAMAAGEGDGRFVIAPPYTPAPEVVPNYEIPQGTLHEFTMDSADSAIFPKDVATGEPFTRAVAVYVPAQYQAGSAAPFMVVMDGVSFFLSIVPVLDNLIHARELPALVAIFVEPGPNSGVDEGQRSYEFDSLSKDWVTFVETELLPRVEQETGVTLTDDPEGRAAMGGSSGGAAAFTMGWFAPEKYRRILTYSGSFTDLQPSAIFPHGAWQYHESLIARSPRQPLRVVLSAGENDAVMNDETHDKRNWIEANERMAKALAAKGYAYRYMFQKGAEHVDFAPIEQTIADDLRWLWQGGAAQ